MLGVGFGAISGLGIAVLYWGGLHAVAFVTSRIFGPNREQWALVTQVAVGILGGVFTICLLNQVFQDDDYLLFALFVALGLVGFMQSVSLDFSGRHNN
ncbi:MAG: hypothetical protein ACKOWI_03960 [Rhodoluna sp.]